MIDDLGTGAVIQYTLREIKNNRHVVSVWTGRPGTGKSWSALRLGELLSEIQGHEFGPPNIVFTPEEYLKKVRDQNNKRGEVIIFDEAGTGFGHLDYMSKINRALQLVMQTMRYRNLINMLTVPHFKHVDKSARIHTDIRFETRHVNKVLGFCIVKPAFLKNDWSGRYESYEQYLRVSDGTVSGKIVKEMKLAKPSKETRKWYQAHKEAFTEKLWAELEEDITETKSGSKEPESLNQFQQLIWDNFESGKYTDHRELAKDLGMSVLTVSSHIRGIRGKGYTFPPPKAIERYKKKLDLSR